MWAVISGQEVEEEKSEAENVLISQQVLNLYNFHHRICFLNTEDVLLEVLMAK